MLLAGVWAALLIPSFVSSRREAPISTTESFARNTARLAAVHAINAETAVKRNQIRARRRQVLIALVAASLATLGVALYTGSWTWLSINLMVDALFAAYIAMLLQVKHAAQEAAFRSVARPEVVDTPEVRVVAG